MPPELSQVRRSRGNSDTPNQLLKGWFAAYIVEGWIYTQPNDPSAMLIRCLVQQVDCFLLIAQCNMNKGEVPLGNEDFRTFCLHALKKLPRSEPVS